MRRSLTCLLLALPLAPALAAEGDNPPSEPREPKVQRIVVEDENARVEELRIRGQTRRIVVHPKKGGTDYEILPGDDTRDVSDGHGTQRGATGKRVWNVLSF